MCSRHIPLDRTLRELQHVINGTNTPSRPLPGSAYYKSLGEKIVGVDCDEVFPGLYVGDEGAAKNKGYLRLLGITHVLNTAEGVHFGQVDTNDAYYCDMPTLRYLGFPMVDIPATNIAKYFEAAARFIEEGLDGGGRVLVHCYMGKSRSATCALAYLMLRKGMSACEAMRTVRLRRDVHPNHGFLRQLAELDDRLRAQRSTQSFLA